MSVQWSMAQAPKWVEKAKRAVFSVVTYDKNDKILNTGNGFFVTEDGIALSDYSLFKGAERAVIVNFEGKQMPVNAILGADDMYDVIKFRVDRQDGELSCGYDGWSGVRACTEVIRQGYYQHLLCCRSCFRHVSKH